MATEVSMQLSLSLLSKEGREDGEEAIRYCGTHMGDPNTNVYIFAGGRYRPREY